ncbi:MAG TPA: SDR family NAD(P)-dependent oxidoreductase, partial [Polyangium sp.]|nr:SDR family NAD(P)-dependent oxidoreductase [Polyangium sp.]
GSATGVFFGMANFDYAVLALQETRQDVYVGLGAAPSTASGRVSNYFGFQGPALTLDTACSSSLVAIHLACQSLRAGESNLALAGGVNAVAARAGMMGIASLQAVSPDGRCKTFDAEANGFVIGEGCGIVALKRLADAQRDGDQILAVIRSSGVNQDGRTSSMTVPNVLSQQALIRRALKQAQLQPEDIGFIEAHGTATPLGDPIEFEALRAVFGKPREDGSKLPLGAVKTNLGHLSGAAGVAGFIKAVQCIRHQTIPPNLNFRTLNPRMSLDGTPFVIPTEKSAWTSNGKPRRAGVSSFGMSGTNAHAIVEESPPVQDEPFTPASNYVLPLSARTPEALATMARAYQQWFAHNDDVPLHHVVYTASMRRSHLEHRLCAVAATREEMAAALKAFVAGEPTTAISTGRVGNKPPRVVFVFPGQGSQWIGMGQQLYREEPIFRDALRACDEAIRKEAGFSVIEELNKPEESSRIHETIVAQPALFAIEVALSALVQSWGIWPSAVAGHSVGEVAAAHVAGMLDLAQATRLVCIRARVMQKATGHGKMVSVALDEHVASNVISGLEHRIGIAAVNDPNSVVLSGDIEALDSLVEKLAQKGVQNRPLRVNYAFHSPQMESLAMEFVTALGVLEVKHGTIPMYSTVTGTIVSDKQLDAEYWRNNIRQTVRFAAAMTLAATEGRHTFLEVGPHPVLALSIEQTLSSTKTESKIITTLRRDRHERKQMLTALGLLHVQGCPVDWSKFYPNRGRVVSLPTYPWQHERYWLESANQDESRSFSPTITTDELRYDTVWQPAPVRPHARHPQAGICLVFMDESGTGAELIKALESRNQTTVQVLPGKEYSARGAQIWIDPTNAADYRRLLDDCLGKTTAPVRVVHLWNLDATPFAETTADTLDADLLQGTLSVSFLEQALAAREWSQQPKLCMVTRGARAVEDGDKNISVAQGPVWGLGCSIVLAHAEWESVLVDLPYAATDGDIDALTREVLNEYEGQTQVAFRSSGRYAAQLVREKRAAQPPADFRLHGDATYLVTGGLGDLGREVARWMVEKGARNLVLVSRRAPNEQAQRTIAAMEEKGARVLALCADVANREDVEQLLMTISEKMPPLRGIVHAAGLAPSAMETTRETMLTITAPKVRGGWNLHQATRGLELDFFVMYSSASAILGLLGGAEYCAGNAFLDTLAHARHGLGVPALSVQWGAFGEVGQIVQVKGATSTYGALDPLMLNDAHNALAVCLAERHTEVSVMHFSIQRHVSLFPHLGRNFFWAALQQENAPKEATKPNRPMTNRRVVEKLLVAKPETRNERLTTYMQHAMSHIVHLDPGRIEMEATLHTLGMDSLMCLELRNTIEKDLSVHIPIKDILGSSSIGGLCDLLGRRLWPDGTTDITATNDKPGNWVVVPRPRPDAVIRLICFPYAGGNASVYSSWVDLIGPKVELCAIQPPGRQERIHEPLLETVEQMVAGIVPALIPYLDKPFAVFGHCVGAMVMYEVVRVLRAKHGLEPVHIFPSGALPPKNYLIPAVDTSLDSDKFVQTLRQIGFAEDSVLGDEESARELLPTVSADFDLAIRYVCDTPTTVNAPITTICGREDQLGPPERTVKWNEITTARFDQVVLPGEHYFLVP